MFPLREHSGTAGETGKILRHLSMFLECSRLDTQERGGLRWSMQKQKNSEPNAAEQLIASTSPDLEIEGGLSRQTFARFRCERKGPAYFKLGGRIFYRRADLLAWRNANRVEPAAA
jgi:hypothetical protein